MRNNIIVDGVEITSFVSGDVTTEVEGDFNATVENSLGINVNGAYSENISGAYTSVKKSTEGKIVADISTEQYNSDKTVKIAKNIVYQLIVMTKI